VRVRVRVRVRARVGFRFRFRLCWVRVSLPTRVAWLSGHPSRLYDDGRLIAFAVVEHEPG
jgi:hypothetical protein